MCLICAAPAPTYIYLAIVIWHNIVLISFVLLSASLSSYIYFHIRQRKLKLLVSYFLISHFKSAPISYLYGHLDQSHRNTFHLKGLSNYHSKDPHTNKNQKSSSKTHCWDNSQTCCSLNKRWKRNFWKLNCWKKIRGLNLGKSLNPCSLARGWLCLQYFFRCLNLLEMG